jgi:FkbM family methyltransferase
MKNVLFVMEQSFSKKMYGKIKACLTVLKKNSFFSKLDSWAAENGVYYPIKIILRHRIAKYYHKNNIPYVAESQEYFASNADRVNNIVAWLGDDESKRCYLNIIEFRKNCDTANFPYHGRKTQYFHISCFPVSDEEVFVDCGAFTGDTVRNFLKKTKNKFKKIIAFEPEDANFNSLRKRTSKLNNVTLVKAGVWDTDTTLFFESQSGSVSKITDGSPREETLISVPVKVIGNVAECNDATLIKMDIEGAEYNAMIGAEKTIVRNKPKLAICIYHSNEDMLRIAEWIHEKVPEYRLYVRHHDLYSAWETVLYAVA